MHGDSPITLMLDAARGGDAAATERLFDAVYCELQKLAHSHRRRWQGNNTINTTALIHEAFIKLARAEEKEYSNRTHFYATASKAMRQILVNYAERQSAAKRGSSAVHVPLENHHFVAESTAEEILSLHEQLTRLEAQNARLCRIVECRIFGGMTIDETADAMHISAATVKRDWRTAITWLYRELRSGDTNAHADSENTGQ